MEYKVIIYQEGMLGSLLLGGSKVDPVRFTDFLNQNAAQAGGCKQWKKIYAVCCYSGSAKPMWSF